MSNGSERVRITNWIENVPLKGPHGEVIGSARISDKGEIIAEIKTVPEELYKTLSFGLAEGISIGPLNIPVIHKYSDEIRTRLAHNNPLKKEN